MQAAELLMGSRQRLGMSVPALLHTDRYLRYVLDERH